MRKCRYSWRTLELPKVWSPQLPQITQQVILLILVMSLATPTSAPSQAFQEYQIIPRAHFQETPTRGFLCKLLQSYRTISRSLWALSTTSRQRCWSKDSGHTPPIYGPLVLSFSSSSLVRYLSKEKLKMKPSISSRSAHLQFLQMSQKKQKIWSPSCSSASQRRDLVLRTSTM